MKTAPGTSGAAAGDSAPMLKVTPAEAGAAAPDGRTAGSSSALELLAVAMSPSLRPNPKSNFLAGVRWFAEKAEPHDNTH